MHGDIPPARNKVLCDLGALGNTLSRLRAPGVLSYEGDTSSPQLCHSAPAPAWSGHVQACGMQPTKGLKALKCSFSERPAFLKCQRSWKRQLAPLPAAQALIWQRDAFAAPSKLEDGGPRTAPMHPPKLKGWWVHRQKSQSTTFLPCSPASAEEEKSLEPSRAVFSLCQ